MIISGGVRFHDALRPLLQPIDDYQRHPENYNEGDMEAIEESFEINGMFRAIEAQSSTGYILDGNHTWEKCKELGSEVIPVIPLDVSDTEALQIMVAANRTAKLARPDPARLLDVLHRIESERGNLLGTAYAEHDLASLDVLAEMPLEYEHAQWPTISVQVPPHVKRAYYKMTRECDMERDRIELLLRLAGWDGT